MTARLVDWISRLHSISGDSRMLLVKMATRNRWDLIDFDRQIVNAQKLPPSIIDELSPFEVAVIHRVWTQDITEDQCSLGTFDFLVGRQPYCGAWYEAPIRPQRCIEDPYFSIRQQPCRYQPPRAGRGGSDSSDIVPEEADTTIHDVDVGAGIGDFTTHDVEAGAGIGDFESQLGDLAAGRAGADDVAPVHDQVANEPARYQHEAGRAARAQAAEAALPNVRPGTIPHDKTQHYKLHTDPPLRNPALASPWCTLRRQHRHTSCGAPTAYRSAPGGAPYGVSFNADRCSRWPARKTGRAARPASAGTFGRGRRLL